jgi:uncharacterized protein (DUF302 family)
MNYYFSKILNDDFDKVIERVTKALSEEGFGILTEIDVKATLKKKLDVDFKQYRILGACNPPFAHKALTAEDKIGVMLPCNVLVIEQGERKIEVAAVDPISSMLAVNNTNLEPIAGQVRDMLKKIVENL